MQDASGFYKLDGDSLETNPGAGNTRLDLITCGYLALKDEPPFNNAGEEQWIDC